MEDRIGERGEPCGVPWFRTSLGVDSLFMVRVMHRSVRNDRTHAQRCGAKPSREKRWTR